MKHAGCILILLIASACTTTAEHHIDPLAVPPRFDTIHTAPDTHYNMHNPSSETTETVSPIETALNALYGPANSTVALSAGEGVNCNIQDRFDRKALLAYQWGRDTRHRLGVDVDGLGWDGADIEEVKLQYTFRLQREKPRKMACRYQSGWQGIVGSGYNEMFQRQDDEGAKADFRKLRQDFVTRWETVWD